MWDSEIIRNESITLESVLNIDGKLTYKEKRNSTQIDVIAWMNDSRAILPFVYNLSRHKTIPTYISDSRVIIEKQLAKGGLMLAAVLNEIFK